MRTKLILISSILLFSINILKSQDEARLLRFPAIHNDQVIFSYAGDLYTYNIGGQFARKLTSHIGYEMFAHFSPDGEQIAFTAQYDGNTEVYLMPSTGGEPLRLTYTATLNRDDISDRMGPNNIVMGWSPDGQNILYRSRKKSFNSFIGQLYSVNIKGGISEELPLPSGGFCSYSPDGSKLAYNRVFREFRTWKYYRGGMADDVWIYDFKSKIIENITKNDAQDIFPMWRENKVYFLSDRDRTMNLFVYDFATKETKKLTNFTEYDVKFPSMGNKDIIFENGGYLYIFNFETQKQEKLSIKIANDFQNAGFQVKDASKNINTVEISPDGSRLVFGARGDIFNVPAENGITVNLSETSGIHEREAEWSPDGLYIAYISDKTGEDEIYMRKQDGSSNEIQLTFNTNIYKFSIKWSPDSKNILWSDQHFKLQYVNIESKKVTEVVTGKRNRYYNYNWSPDSKWISYSESEKDKMTTVFIYNLESKVSTSVTKGWFYSTSPLFSSDGKYLIFVSSRSFSPIYSEVEWNYAYNDMSKIYLALLASNTTSPFAPKNDVVNISEKKLDDKKGKKDGEKSIVIDIEGLSDRIIEIPVKRSNYYNISYSDEKIYYIERQFNGTKSNFKLYDLKKKKESVLSSNINYIISNNEKKMLILKGGKYYIIDKPSSKITLENAVDLSGMKVRVNLEEEWKQIYTEAWRQMRDFFYAKNMHGTDWSKMYEKYAVLLPYVKHRADLNYLIGELIGELSVGHAYISGGDRPLADKVKLGLLGANISKHSSGFYQIDHILDGANWNKSQRSPLTEVGVKAEVGNFIVAVNGKPTNVLNDFYESMVGMAGRTVELTLNTKPSFDGSWKVLVTTIDDESELYYYNWVQNNLKKVTEATNGQIGYIHIPDMVSYGLNEFVKYYYPQLTKKGLIIDDRGNGGGNVSAMIIERLMREMTYVNVRTNLNYGTTNPGGLNIGPKVMLINNYSASDGDLVAYRFQHNKIGKIIGVRSWGGVVGISGSLPFIDGGDLRKPAFAPYAADGSGWIIEGHGIDPDIVIDNDPAKEYAGEDEQLNKAIEVILEELKSKGKEIPPVPEFPDKTR